MGYAGDDLIRLSAVTVRDLLIAREVSPLDLVEAAAARIAAVEPAINALPTLCLDRARDHARRIMAGTAREGLLCGLPIAVKDLNPVAGVRTTWGSPIFRDHVPAKSDALVSTLEDQGGIVVAKSNTPEFGAGASTFNEVFGRTRNPWDTAKSVAGSSGGSAAALAAGEVWGATGSDLGGSLRTPASFNGIVGLRTTPGRVPRAPVAQPFSPLFVEGPMGRSVEDVALLLDAMSHPHADDPLSLPAPGRTVLEAVRTGAPPKRVAFSPDLGLGPVSTEVREICAAAARRFEEMGAVVEEASPDLTGAKDAFQTLRALWFAAEMAEHYRDRRDMLKPDIVWNIERGLKLTAEEIGQAELARGRVWHEMARFFETYDVLLAPAAIVPPFAVETRYVEEVEGHRFDNYVDWLAITFAISVTSCPAASVPAGLTKDGLPVGLQIVGPRMGEAGILTAARHYEAAMGLHRMLPRDPAA